MTARPYCLAQGLHLNERKGYCQAVVNTFSEKSKSIQQGLLAERYSIIKFSSGKAIYKCVGG